MSDKKINLKKVIVNLGENFFPNIHYFMNGFENGHDGSVDGSNDNLYKGLIHGEGLDELGIDQSILESEKPILELCKIILEKGGVLFFGLGLVYYEGGEELILDEEYSIIMDEESLEKYYIGGYGIVLTKDEWNYGYYTVCLSHCFLPPEEKYYYLDNDDEEDKVAMEIMKRIDEMDIYD